MKKNERKNNSSTEDVSLKSSASTAEKTQDDEYSSVSSMRKAAEYLSENVRKEMEEHIRVSNEINRKYNREFLEKYKNDYKDDIDKKTRDLEDKIENSKLSIIETLGIFVALFTFISIDFQVFKSYRNPIAIGALTSILIGAIFLFIIVFDYFILQARKVRKSEKNNKSQRYLEDERASKIRKILFVASFVLIILGIFAFSRTTPENLEDSKIQIKNDILNSLKSDINSQNKEVVEKAREDNASEIREINNNIEEMKKCIKNFGFTYRCF